MIMLFFRRDMSRMMNQRLSRTWLLEACSRLTIIIIAITKRSCTWFREIGQKCIRRFVVAPSCASIFVKDHTELVDSIMNETLQCDIHMTASLRYAYLDDLFLSEHVTSKLETILVVKIFLLFRTVNDFYYIYILYFFQNYL